MDKANLALTVAAFAVLASPVPLKAVAFLNYMLNKSFRQAGAQAVAWLAGVLAAVLFRLSDFASDAGIAGLNIYSVVIVGIWTGSAASVTFDALPASASKPSLSAKLFKRTPKTSVKGADLPEAESQFVPLPSAEDHVGEDLVSEPIRAKRVRKAAAKKTTARRTTKRP